MTTDIGDFLVNKSPIICIIILNKALSNKIATVTCTFDSFICFQLDSMPNLIVHVLKDIVFVKITTRPHHSQFQCLSIIKFDTAVHHLHC